MLEQPAINIYGPAPPLKSYLQKLKKFFLTKGKTFLPPLIWIPGFQERMSKVFSFFTFCLLVYDWKHTLLFDLLAGVTVGVFLVPQAMAYSVLAGLPIEIGLYASTVPVLVKKTKLFSYFYLSAYKSIQTDLCCFWHFSSNGRRSFCVGCSACRGSYRFSSSRANCRRTSVVQHSDQCESDAVCCCGFAHVWNSSSRFHRQFHQQSISRGFYQCFRHHHSNRPDSGTNWRKGM
jgi:hypothetical protein